MADVAPTQVSGTGTKIIGKAGVTVAAGQWVYYDTTNKDYRLTDADTAPTALVRGVALGDAEAGENFVILTDGIYDPGVALTPGLIYVISDTAGAIAPIDDQVGVNGTGDFVSMVGRGNTNGDLAIAINHAVDALP